MGASRSGLEGEVWPVEGHQRVTDAFSSQGAIGEGVVPRVCVKDDVEIIAMA